MLQLLCCLAAAVLLIRAPTEVPAQDKPVDPPKTGVKFGLLFQSS